MSYYSNVVANYPKALPFLDLVQGDSEEEALALARAIHNRLSAAETPRNRQGQFASPKPTPSATERKEAALANKDFRGFIEAQRQLQKEQENQ